MKGCIVRGIASHGRGGVVEGTAEAAAWRLPQVRAMQTAERIKALRSSRVIKASDGIDVDMRCDSPRLALLRQTRQIH